MVQATGSIELGLVCLFGLGIWAVRHPVMAAAMSPLLGLALLNFVIGNRFIFYATPMMWFGLGYFSDNTCRIYSGKRFDEAVQPVAAQCPAFICSGPWAPGRMDKHTNGICSAPTFSKEVLVGFAAVNGQYDPESTVVATWWDYGYASTFLNNLPVLHYGGAVNTATTHFMAQAFLDEGQPASFGTMKFLASQGSGGIRSFDNLEALEAAFSDAFAKPSPDILVVVTNQMAGWMGSISKIGNWDIEAGKPVTPRGNPNWTHSITRG